MSESAITKSKPGPSFEDVKPGDELPALAKGPITSIHLMRWSAAVENWHRIHYDEHFATGHDRLPGLLVNGSLKQNYLLQLLKDWAGSTGWVWKASFQFRAMDIVNARLTIWARVTRLERTPAFGLVHLEIGIRNTDDRESTPGTAVVALPYKGGPPVPYPFEPPTKQSD